MCGLPDVGSSANSVPPTRLRLARTLPPSTRRISVRDIGARFGYAGARFRHTRARCRQRPTRARKDKRACTSDMPTRPADIVSADYRAAGMKVCAAEEQAADARVCAGYTRDRRNKAAMPAP